MVHRRNGKQGKRVRQERAEKRALAPLDPSDVALQIEALDRRLGVGVGAVKERARLARILEAAK